MTERRQSGKRLRPLLLPGGLVFRALPRGTPPHGRGGPGFPFEFHVGAAARLRYRFADSLFRSNGNVVFADFRAVREFASRMNETGPPGGRPVRAGELNAMGLIDEILHFVFRLYETQVNPGVLSRGIAAMEDDPGHLPFRTTLHEFVGRFPPVAVFRGGQDAAAWLDGATDGRRHPEVSLEELLMLHLANINPAFAPFRPLFDDTGLAAQTAYGSIVSGLRSFLRSEKRFGPAGLSILDFLEAPMRASPESLAGQLAFIRDSWGIILSEEFRRRILTSEDLSREDAKQYPAGGAGTVTAPDYAYLARTRPGEYPETENFTHDTEWMPNVVLIAKNVYVWLHQLSRAHGRRMTRLDEIPDAELDRLASWNFTSVWLIGIWSRSGASERIKRMTGNPEAAPSAYSLYEYEIAPDLGGEEAFGDLARRAWARGIRLAADMVPNHTGIASRWIREHPDRFIQADHPPFPSYRFTGPDLSADPDYQVRIEDGYWTRADAAVVFQRIDNRDGRARYIYHGNDGTNMPWNDTAQLDFLRRDVREAVIGEILRVAEKFSVIRFDAAMTLTKKHFQRLWYPHPGTGGDIPSRADHGMLQEDFDREFPEEFWREVVDRINRAMPNTLLLAEAFWLLEGYFVRTLGMHRVYNSAFMHMLMKEDNAMYRGAIRSTLHYNPEILKRYVNFMSNPDERTAVDQFGKGDKYFGVATLMATLPGLPMFAHGQVEGFREKYGMEYRRDYHDESPDADLVRRHEREIFPLLGMRRIFSQTEHFELYDVTGPDGAVVEDIFAYSNMAGGERTLVVYNNRYETWAGAIRMSAGKLAGGTIRYLSLGDALRLNGEDGVYYRFREQRSGLEFVRSGAGLHRDGLFIRLRAFESQVFLDFREEADLDGAWGRLHAGLAGGGIPDAAKAVRFIRLGPFHDAVRTLFDGDFADRLASYLEDAGAGDEEFPREAGRRLETAARAMAALPGATGLPDPRGAGAEFALRVARLRKFLTAPARAAEGSAPWRASAAARPAGGTGRILFATAVAALLINDPGDRTKPVPEAVFDAWLFGEALESAFAAGRPDDARNSRDAQAVRALACGEGFSSPAAARALGLNEYQGITYFHRESFEELLAAVLAAEAFRRGAASAYVGKGWEAALDDARRAWTSLTRAAEESGYRYRDFLGCLPLDEFRTLAAGQAPLTPQGH
jgi:glycosidase